MSYIYVHDDTLDVDQWYKHPADAWLVWDQVQDGATRCCLFFFLMKKVLLFSCIEIHAICCRLDQGRKEGNVLFIYGYMALDIGLRTILIVRKETRCHHIGYSYRLAARVLLYAPSHRQDSTYHSLCYTSCGALAGTRNSSMGPPHEGSIRRPIAPWANALTTELHLAP